MCLTRKEVVEVLCVSVRTITTYMQQGAIPNPKRVGRILLWDEEELPRKIMYSSACVANHEGIKWGHPRKVRALLAYR